MPNDMSKLISKQAPFATSVDGESFSGALSDGFIACAPDTPFQRSLQHIVERRQKLKAEKPMDYDDYGNGRVTSGS
jgi:hypothetical protein